MVVSPPNLSCTCVVAGGGPAGIVTGFLLARAGVDVIVLEKHEDFLRDFRGDTIHPSTMEVMRELGLIEEFLQLPHQSVKYAEFEIGNQQLRIADFTGLPTPCKYVAFMPQWHFLNFIAEKAKRYSNFRLLMRTEALDLKRGDGGKVIGLKARDPSGELEIEADVVIGADGRSSQLRDAAGLAVTDLGAPMDVLWFKLAYGKPQGHFVFGRIVAGQVVVMLDRGDYWQTALIIPKGTADAVKAEGPAAFRARVAALVGRDNVDEIKSLDDVRLLTVKVDRLEQWASPGLLFIGDAAHAMSPIGGVGINLAIQDAVATANILAEPLRNRTVSLKDLQAVQDRRMFPARMTQKIQTLIQNNVIDPVVNRGKPPKVLPILKLMQHLTWMQRLLGRVIGLGLRPEHVRTEERA